MSVNIYNEYFSHEIWYIINGKHAGYIPKGNITANTEPELFDNEAEWKARCKQLGIEDET